MRDRFLSALARLAVERNGLVLGVALALTLLSGGAAAWLLEIDSNQDHLVSADLEYQRRFLDFLETFGDRELLYVVVDAEHDLAGARAVVAEVSSALREQPELFPRVSAGLELAELADRALLLAPEAEVARLAEHATELGELGRLDGFVSLFELWTRQLGDAEQAGGSAEEAQVGFAFLRFRGTVRQLDHDAAALRRAYRIGDGPAPSRPVVYERVGVPT